MGTITGGVSGYKYAKDNGLDLWSGVKIEPTSFFDGTYYSEKVLKQMELNDFHSFPESVKAFELDGTITPLKGVDKITRPILKIPGNYRGREGHFEFIKERNGKINHRLFRPNIKK